MLERQFQFYKFAANLLKHIGILISISHNNMEEI